MKVFREVYEEDCYRLNELPDLGDSALTVDVGAHIGSFACKWHELHPRDRIVCIEACHDNIDLLQENVGAFARVVHSACSYEPGELLLLNSICDDGTATGASRIVRADAANFSGFGHAVKADRRLVPKATLEQLAAGMPIDLLKLDCEGSEYSILQGMVERKIQVRCIVGEYHDRDRWEPFRREILKGWSYREISQHARQPLGIFHAFNLHAGG
jgi:FkbM family methyltransferase